MHPRKDGRQQRIACTAARRTSRSAPPGELGLSRLADKNGRKTSPFVVIAESQPASHRTDAKDTEPRPASGQYSAHCVVGLYNDIRPHWALIPEAGGDVVTPTDVYTGKVRTKLPRWQGWAREAKKRLEEMLLKSA